MMKFLIASSPRFAGPNTIFPDLEVIISNNQQTQNNAILGEREDDNIHLLSHIRIILNQIS